MEIDIYTPTMIWFKTTCPNDWRVIEAATGISVQWLRHLHNGRIVEPGVHKMQTLHNYFRTHAA